MLQDKLYVFCRLFYRAFKNDLSDSTDTQSELYVHCYDCNDWETVWKKKILN